MTAWQELEALATRVRSGDCKHPDDWHLCVRLWHRHWLETRVLAFEVIFCIHWNTTTTNVTIQT